MGSTLSIPEPQLLISKVLRLRHRIKLYQPRRISKHTGIFFWRQALDEGSLGRGAVDNGSMSKCLRRKSDYYLRENLSCTITLSHKFFDMFPNRIKVFRSLKSQ
jgi:hypothetical protein